MLRRLFVPHYEELTLFLLLSGLLFFLATDLSTTTRVASFLLGEEERRMIPLLLIVLAGAALSGYHAFAARKKRPFEKWLMLVFGVILSVVAGLYAGWHVLATQRGLLAVLPAVNLGHAMLLLALLRFEVLDEHDVSDGNARATDAVLGLLVILGVVLATRYAFSLHPSLVLSTSVGVATSLGSLIGDRGVPAAGPDASDERSRRRHGLAPPR